MAGQPVGGGEHQLGPQTQPQGFLEQMGPLQKQAALIQPATGAVQAPHRLDEGIADAADQLVHS